MLLNVFINIVEYSTNFFKTFVLIIFGFGGATNINNKDLEHEQDLALLRHKNESVERHLSSLLQPMKDDNFLENSRKMRESIKLYSQKTQK